MSEQLKSAPVPVDVVLPAGGRISGAFAEEAGASVKALIRLGDETILRRTVRILRETNRIGRIVVVGPEETLAEARECGADADLLEGDTGPENIFRGLQWLELAGNAAERALILTTDLPFLTPAAITRFLDACPPHAELALPVITREAFEGRFPNASNLYVPLRDGAFTLGCAFLVHSKKLIANRVHVEGVFRARKSQLAMARLLGALFIVRLVTRRLDVARIEERCSQILDCRGMAVRGSPAELAFDIDLIEEYRYAVQRILPSNAAPAETRSNPDG